MAWRPSDEWQRQVDEQAAQMARGELSAEDAYAMALWSDSLRADTDAALNTFEAELGALNHPPDADVLRVAERLVVGLNQVNGTHVNAGLVGYETEEREQLCDYIEASLEEAGIQVRALEARNGMSQGELVDRWRDW